MFTCALTCHNASTNFKRQTQEEQKSNLKASKIPRKNSSRLTWSM